MIIWLDLLRFNFNNFNTFTASIPFQVQTFLLEGCPSYRIARPDFAQNNDRVLFRSYALYTSHTVCGEVSAYKVDTSSN